MGLNQKNGYTEKTLHVSVSGLEYDIRIKDGLLQEIPNLLLEKYTNRKIALCCDSNVRTLFGDALLLSLQNAGFQTFLVSYSAGETFKTLETLSHIYGQLAEKQFSRSDLLLAFGGGVTGDMAGLAAATFLRGTAFIQIPTTLLAMVDSSIGGKLAVDLPQGKNLVGAFYQPKAVYTDPQLLASLNDAHFFNGMAELIKHGFIFDAGLVQRIQETVLIDRKIDSDASTKTGISTIPETDLQHQNTDISVSRKEAFLHAGIDVISDVNASSADRNNLMPNMSSLIAESCNLKRIVVEKDEKDEGPRQLLNFGHTLGHAIEKVTGFGDILHGEAIAIGMSVFTHLSESLGWTEEGTAAIVDQCLTALHLPITFPKISVPEVVKTISSDKKVRSGYITIVTLDKIGLGRLRTMSVMELEDVLYGYLHG